MIGAPLTDATWFLGRVMVPTTPGVARHEATN